MTKEEKAEKFFSSGYNCAQAVLGVFCEEAGLDLKTAFKISNGFGGGARCGELCGAVSGAVMAIGLKCGFFVENDIEQKNYCNKKTYEFIEKFKKANGSIVCRELLGVDVRCPEDHTTEIVQSAHKSVCPKLVKNAVKILEEMKELGL